MFLGAISPGPTLVDPLSDAGTFLGLDAFTWGAPSSCPCRCRCRSSLLCGGAGANKTNAHLISKASLNSSLQPNTSSWPNNRFTVDILYHSL